MPGFSEVMRVCRENFGTAPRSFGDAEQQAFKLQPSLIMRIVLTVTFDKLRTVLRDQDILRDQGRVVWGFLVQANQVLFNPKNRQVMPANAIYSPDPYFDDRVRELLDVAQGLFQLKETYPGNREMKKFANAVTNEMLRTMRLAIPRDLCDGKEAYFTTCLIQPSHLPGGYIAAGFFPLVICPEKTKAVMILPAPYWPEELRASWIGE